MRAGTPDDHALVYETWLRHYRRHGTGLDDVPEATYRTEQRLLVASILARASLILAVDSEDPTLVWGYVVSEPRALHWLWTKAVCRRHGVARALGTTAAALQQAQYYTHRTSSAEDIMRRIGLRLTYNPWRAWVAP